MIPIKSSVLHIAEGHETFRAVRDSIEDRLNQSETLVNCPKAENLDECDVQPDVTHIHFWVCNDPLGLSVQAAQRAAKFFSSFGRTTFIHNPDSRYTTYLHEKEAESSYDPIISELGDFSVPYIDCSILPIADDGLEMPPLDLSVLPNSLARWAGDTAERMGVAVEYLVVSILVVLSSVLGRKLRVRPKQKDDWTVVTLLWGMLVGRPGIKKSPALEKGVWFINQLEKDERERFLKAVEKVNGKLADFDFDIADLEFKLSKAKKDSSEKKEIALKIWSAGVLREPFSLKLESWSTVI